MQPLGWKGKRNEQWFDLSFVTPENGARGEFLRLWDPKGHKKQGPKKAPEFLRVFSFKLNVKTHSAFSKRKEKTASYGIQSRKPLLSGFVSGILCYESIWKSKNIKI